MGSDLGGRRFRVFFAWVGLSLGIAVAFGSNIRLRSSSGVEVTVEVAFFMWLLVLVATAPWVSRIAATSPTEPKASAPPPDLTHLGPELETSLTRLIQSARIAAACLESDGADGSRMLWDFTEELKSAPAHVHAFLERSGVPTDFRRGVKALYAFEVAISDSTVFGYRH